MKNSEKKAKAKGIYSALMPFVKTVVSGINPIIGGVVGMADGAVKAVQKEKEKNLSTNTGGVGKVNPTMLLGQVLSFLVIIGGGFAMIMGWLTIDDVKSLVKLFLSMM